MRISDWSSDVCSSDLIATSFHVMQRTSRARMPDQLSFWFALIGYNLFCVLAVSGYFIGITQSTEYAEAEWYADIWLVIVWVAYLVLYMRTLARRQVTGTCLWWEGVVSAVMF